jgi:hypothetical protein
MNYTKDLYLDDTFTILFGYGVSYINKPWEHIGPIKMINVVNLLYSMEIKDVGDKVSMQTNYTVCEVFFVHMCETARCRSLKLLYAKH